MRTRGRGRGFLRALLCSRAFLALCLLAPLGGLSGLNGLGVVVGRPFISPAEAGKISPSEARKAGPLLPRTFRLDVHRPLRGFQARGFAFAPSIQKPAVLPTAKSAPFAAFPASLPVPPAVTTRRLAPEPAAEARWEVRIRQAASEPKRAPPSPLAARSLPAPPQAPAPVAAKTHTPFHRLLGKLSAQSRYGSRASRAAAAPNAKGQVGPAVRAGSTRLAARRLGGRPVGELLPPIGSFNPDEVLAINLSAEGLAKVREDNYTVVGRVELPGFGLTLTRLKPPANLNAISARGRLFDLLPEDGFTLNHVYSPYRPGSGRPSAAGAVAAQSGKSCPPERCFGGALIKWEPRLAACARDVKVGIIDTGFDMAHPAFAGVRYDYMEFLPEGRPRASNQHGTGVLSLLAGSADSGTPGLIPDAAYAIANAFFADSAGQPISDTAQMLQALHWLRKSGAAVVNLSFAGPKDELVHHAIQELTRAGVVVIAAAGNDGPGAPPSYPAAYQEVIAVTAVDRNLAAYRYAGRGEHIDIAAPGVDVWTAMPGRREGPQTGTSFAVPYVTAVVAVALPPSELAVGEDARASKRRALGRLQGNIQRLGGELRNPTFGAGLVQAPASCDSLPVVAVAGNAAQAARAWTGTVRRALAPAVAEPLVVGSWISTVHAASGGDGLTR